MKVELQYAPVDMMVLQKQWLSLQPRATHRFFTSWVWIDNWLRTYDAKPWVLSAQCEGQVVALLLLCRHPSSAFKIVPLSSLHCNQTGDPAKDQIWPEYNCVMVDARYTNTVMPLLADYLKYEVGDWDELVIGASTRAVIDELHAHLRLEYLELWESPSFGVDLNALRRNNTNYLESLSRNTRYQIRRAEKRYEQEGVLCLERAASAQEALQFFNAAGPLHLDRWGTSLQGSGYANPQFIRFHENLIRSAWDSGVIELMRLRVGKRIIAYLYNFIYQDRVYFYLSALSHERDAKLKPGLVAHARAIQEYLENGLAYYDFMGGDDRYKRSLGAEAQQLVKVAFRKNKLIFRAENFARRIKKATLPSG